MHVILVTLIKITGSDMVQWHILRSIY